MLHIAIETCLNFGEGEQKNKPCDLPAADRWAVTRRDQRAPPADQAGEAAKGIPTEGTNFRGLWVVGMRPIHHQIGIRHSNMRLA